MSTLAYAFLEFLLAPTETGGLSRLNEQQQARAVMCTSRQWQEGFLPVRKVPGLSNCTLKQKPLWRSLDLLLLLPLQLRRPGTTSVATEP